MSEEQLRVLLVDDEASLREPLAKYLKASYRYHVDTAADADEALQQIAEVERPYDVALIDDLLTPRPSEEPEPIGIELMRRVKERCPDAEIIVFTGWSKWPGWDKDRGLKALQAGAYRYLSKPFDYEELGMTIRMAAEQARLRRERDLLAAILEISNAMVSGLEAEKTLGVIAEAVPKLVRAEACAVARVDSATGRVSYEPMVPLGDAAVRWHRHLRDVELTRRVIETGKPFGLSDVDTRADEVDENLRRAGVRSFIGVPIPGEPQNLGVLYAYSIRREAFGTHERRVLQLLAGQAAIALENARLHTDVEQKAERLQRLLETATTMAGTQDMDQGLQTLAEKMVTSAITTFCRILLLENDRQHLTVRAAYPIARTQRLIWNPGKGTRYRLADVPGIARVLETRERQVFRQGNAEGQEVLARIQREAELDREIGSALIIPLEATGEVLGVCMLCEMRNWQRRPFSKDKVDFACSIAAQAAVFIGRIHLYEIVCRKLDESEHMRKAAEVMAGALNPPEVLQRIVESARQVLQADSSAIWSYDNVRNQFIPEELVAVGIRRKELEEFKKEELKPEGTAHTIMQEGYMAVTDISKPDISFLGDTTRGLLNRIGVRSFQGIALQVGDERLGVLYVNYNSPRTFGEEEEATLRAFASYAALALKKARLLEQVSKARDAARHIASVMTLEDLPATLESIVKATKEVADCDTVTLYAYDQDKDDFVYPPTTLGLRDEKGVRRLDHVERNSAIRRVLVLDHPHIAEDARTDTVMRRQDGELHSFVSREAVKSSVGIPLNVGDRKVGVMFVSYRSRHRFTADELTNIEFFANQAAVAIRNAQLYEQTMRRTASLQALYEAGKALSGTLALDDILNRIVEQAWQLTGRYGKQARFSHLALKEGSRLTFKAACPSVYLPGLQRGVGDIDLEQDKPIGVTGRAVKTGRSQLVGDVTQDPDYIAYDPETRSELAMPIKLREEVVGVINVEHPDYNAFDEDDRRDLESLAAQAALAIQNAQLYAELKQRYEDLRQIKGFVGSQTALDWMRMVSGVWGHSIKREVGESLVCAELVRQAIQKDNPEDALEELAHLERFVKGISKIPITAPLSAEDAVSSVRVNQLIETFLRSLWDRRGYEIELAFDLQPDLDRVATVRASPEWLRRGVEIVVDNAVQAMLDSDSLQKRLLTTTRSRDGQIEILIRDIGPGIPDEIKPKLFKEPIDKRPGNWGAGLGLVLARTIFEAYRGSIELGETGPHGTLMVISLPIEVL